MNRKNNPKTSALQIYLEAYFGLNATNALAHVLLKKVFSLNVNAGLFYAAFCMALTTFSFSIKANSNLVDKVVPISNEYLNSIEILDNRFRIDSDIEAVTLLFFREYGTAPIVLVRPDGSKLFLENDDEDDTYSWFETDKYDLISLEKPMPGPWQAIGDILPGSRVMVIAGITLNAQKIPDIVFSGESIKQTARLENQGSKIDMSLFRDVVSLTIEFVSTNNPEFPNFGLGSRPVARFKDNGLGFDEEDGDGVFTGQFDLQITEGEWSPTFTVRTPLFSREHVNKNIVLLPTPLVIEHTEAQELEETHEVRVAAMPQYIEANSLILDGTVRHPNGDIQRFSLTDDSTHVNDDIKRISITNHNYGIYKIEMMAFAKTITGRDIVLTVPQYSFATKAPIIEVAPSPVKMEAAEVVPIEEPQNKEEVEPSYLLYALIVNLCILVFGCLIVLLLVKKRTNKNLSDSTSAHNDKLKIDATKTISKAKVDEESQSIKPLGRVLLSLKKLFSKKNKGVADEQAST